MRKIVAVASLCALAACAPPSRGVPETIVIVSDATFPPFHFLDDAGTPTGFDIELARRMVEIAGFQAKVEVKPYAVLHSGLASGEHDLVAATTGVTAERREKYLFTRPYFETSQVALVRTGADEPADLAALDGLKVGASGAGTAAAAMRSIVGATHVALSEEGTGPLEEGLVDAIIVDELDAVAMARASEGTLRVLREPVASEHYAFVVALGREELRDAIDEALTEIEASGDLAALRARFGVDRDASWPVERAR